MNTTSKSKAPPAHDETPTTDPLPAATSAGVPVQPPVGTGLFGDAVQRSPSMTPGVIAVAPPLFPASTYAEVVVDEKTKTVWMRVGSDVICLGDHSVLMLPSQGLIQLVADRLNATRTLAPPATSRVPSTVSKSV